MLNLLLLCKQVYKLQAILFLWIIFLLWTYLIWLTVKVNKIGFLLEFHFISFYWMLMYYHTASLPCSDSTTVAMAYEDGKPCPVYSFLFLLGLISDIVFFSFRSTHNEMEKNRYVIKSSYLLLVFHACAVPEPMNSEAQVQFTASKFWVWLVSTFHEHYGCVLTPGQKLSSDRNHPRVLQV